MNVIAVMMQCTEEQQSVLQFLKTGTVRNSVRNGTVTFQYVSSARGKLTCVW